MKLIRIIFFAILILLLHACTKDPSINVQVEGTIQKGPFIIGTNVTLNELDSNLKQTGRSFNTLVESDDGKYDLGTIALASKYALVTASGYYFNEVFGTLSSDPIWLQAIIDVSEANTFNINVLTHLTGARIETLMEQGLGFDEAKSQTENEFLSFLNAEGDVQSSFESLDLSLQDEGDAALLAFSVILSMKDPTHSIENTSAISELLNRIRQDFTPDGVVDNHEIIDTLIYNVGQLKLPEIRKNIETRFQSLGQSTPIGNFEKYIGKFQEKYATTLYDNFFYPDSAGLLDWNEFKLPNILNDTIPVVQGSYVVAAATPLNSTLKIVLRNTGSGRIVVGTEYGFELVPLSDGFMYISQRQNQLMTSWLELGGHGSMDIEYYENSPDTPTRIRPVTW